MTVETFGSSQEIFGLPVLQKQLPPHREISVSGGRVVIVSKQIKDFLDKNSVLYQAITKAEKIETYKKIRPYLTWIAVALSITVVGGIVFGVLSWYFSRRIEEGYDNINRDSEKIISDLQQVGNIDYLSRLKQENFSLAAFGQVDEIVEKLKDVNNKDTTIRTDKQYIDEQYTNKRYKISEPINHLMQWFESIQKFKNDKFKDRDWRDIEMIEIVAEKTVDDQNIAEDIDDVIGELETWKKGLATREEGNEGNKKRMLKVFAQTMINHLKDIKNGKGMSNLLEQIYTHKQYKRQVNYDVLRQTVIEINKGSKPIFIGRLKHIKDIIVKRLEKDDERRESFLKQMQPYTSLEKEIEGVILSPTAVIEINPESAVKTEILKKIDEVSDHDYYTRIIRFWREENPDLSENVIFDTLSSCEQKAFAYVRDLLEGCTSYSTQYVDGPNPEITTGLHFTVDCLSNNLRVSSLRDFLLRDREWPLNDSLYKYARFTVEYINRIYSIISWKETDRAGVENDSLAPRTILVVAP